MNNRTIVVFAIGVVILSIFATSAMGYALCGFDWNWMGGSPVTVNYKVNGNCLDASAGSSQNQIDVIQLADNTWDQAGASFNFNYNGTHSNTNAGRNNVNEVLWRNVSGGGALATTTIWFSGNNIVECDMVFWDSGIIWHGGSGAPPSTMYDIQSVCLHEFGHFLCLDHTSIVSAVMYYAISNGQMKRTLHSDDIAGIHAIYPEAFPPPHGLIAEDGYDRYVPLFWQPPISGTPSEYQVFRSNSSGGTYNQIGAAIQTQYTDYGLTNGQTYWYKVKAAFTNPSGISDFSNADDGTPQAQPVLDVSPDNLNFGTVTVNQSHELDLWIFNIGSLTLNVTNIRVATTAYEPNFNFSSTQFSVVPDDSFQVTITFTPTQQQSYSTGFGIFNNSLEPVVIVPVQAAGTLLDVPENEFTHSPDSYKLYQNHPNPFNPITTISYDIPANTYVRLHIYDVLGNLVTTLVDHYSMSGSYSVTWNASDYPSGIYFYSLKTDQYFQLQKMLLLK